jgi:hypothetical protein
MAQWSDYKGLIVPESVSMAKRLEEAQREQQSRTARGKFFSSSGYTQGSTGTGYTKPADTLPFDFLRQARDKSLIDKIIINARIIQMKHIAKRVIVPGKQIGFRVVHENYADPNFKPSAEVLNRCKEMERIIDNVNTDIHPAGFRDFAAIAVDQELTYDRKCFPYDTMLETDQGPMWIGKIVQQRLPIRIRSIDLETGKEVWGQVVDWQIIRGVKEWIRLKYDGGGRYHSLVVTPDHEIWTEKGMVPAEQLSAGDTVFISGARASTEQHQLILGSILGDGFFNVRKGALPKFGVGHCVKQREYLNWKYASLSNFNPGSIYEKRTKAYTNGSYHDSIEFRTSGSSFWHSYLDRCYNKDRKREISWNWLSELTELGLAIWMMDDGSIQASNGNKGGSPNFSLTVYANDLEINTIKRYFDEKWGLQPRFDGKRQSKTNSEYRVWAINFRVNETSKILDIVSKYLSIVPNGKNYSKKWIAANFLSVGDDGLIPVQLKSATRYEATAKKRTSYDVTVDPTHTIIAHRLVTSNCMVVTRDRTGRPIRYHLVDGTTIRPMLLVLHSYMHDKKIPDQGRAIESYYSATGIDLSTAAYVQIINGMPVAAWTQEEMSVDITNPSVEIDKWAYGAGSLLEQSIAATVTWLNATAYNDGLFNQDSPESLLLLYGDVDPIGLGAFQRQVLDQTGSGDYQKIPVITADADFKAELIKIRELPKDIQFPELMRMNIMLKTAAYRAHPSLVNFSIDKGSGGGMNLGSHSEDEIVKKAHEEGFISICHSQAAWLTKTIIKPRYEDLVMIYEVDTEDESRRIEVLNKQTEVSMTFNENRRAQGLEGDLEFGDIPNNANYIQAMQMQIQVKANNAVAVEGSKEDIKDPQKEPEQVKKSLSKNEKILIIEITE